MPERPAEKQGQACRLSPEDRAATVPGTMETQTTAVWALSISLIPLRDQVHVQG